MSLIQRGKLQSSFSFVVIVVTFNMLLQIALPVSVISIHSMKLSQQCNATKVSLCFLFIAKLLKMALVAIKYHFAYEYCQLSIAKEENNAKQHTIPLHIYIHVYHEISISTTTKAKNFYTKKVGKSFHHFEQHPVGKHLRETTSTFRCKL